MVPALLSAGTIGFGYEVPESTPGGRSEWERL